jgi:hypothetical protein
MVDMLLWAVVDDSFILDPQSGLPTYVGHGGAIVTPQQLKNLEREWTQALGKYCVKKPFDMADFENYRGQFSGWSEEMHQEFLNNLLAIIKRNTTAYIGYSTPYEEQRSFADKRKAFIQAMLHSCSLEAAKFRDGKINFILAPQAQAEQIRISKDIESAIPMLSEARPSQSEGSHVPIALQIADLLAYEFVRWKNAPKPGNARYPIRFLARGAVQPFYVTHA